MFISESHGIAATHAIAAGCYNSVSGHVPLHTYFTD